MFKLNRDLGYFSIEIFNFMFLFVWDFCGNCYGGRRVIRVNWRHGVWLANIQFVCKRWRTTEFYLFAKGDWFHWNSEHIALKFGEYHEPGYAGTPEHWTYSGILGHHHYI